MSKKRKQKRNKKNKKKFKLRKKKKMSKRHKKKISRKNKKFSFNQINLKILINYNQMGRLTKVLIYKIKKIQNKDFKQEAAQLEVNNIQKYQKINNIGKSHKNKVIHHSLGLHTLRTNVDPNNKDIKTSILSRSHISSNSNVAILPRLSVLSNPRLINASFSHK